jgi:hypothetical protein
MGLYLKASGGLSPIVSGRRGGTRSDCLNKKPTDSKKGFCRQVVCSLLMTRLELSLFYWFEMRGDLDQGSL